MRWPAMRGFPTQTPGVCSMCSAMRETRAAFGSVFFCCVARPMSESYRKCRSLSRGHECEKSDPLQPLAFQSPQRILCLLRHDRSRSSPAQKLEHLPGLGGADAFQHFHRAIALQGLAAEDVGLHALADVLQAAAGF